jgi:hypothetical protein
MYFIKWIQELLTHLLLLARGSRMYRGFVAKDVEEI